MFEFSYTSYLNHAYPADELDPVNCIPKTRDYQNPNNWGINDVLGNFSLTLVDTLDTLAVMGMQKEFEKGIKLVIDNVSFDLDNRVQVFEVTIRMLGGLLSTHLLAINPKLPSYVSWYNGELLDLAKDLADRLMPAFRTPFGLPFPRVNLRKGVLEYEIPEACTAGAGTLLLEFGTLSRLTGDRKYEQAARKALFEIWNRRSRLDLVGNTMSIFDRDWVDQISGIGAGIDSFFEYMLKAYILLGGDGYLEMYETAYKSIKNYLFDAKGFVFKNVNMSSGQLATAWIDSLSAFFPGLQVLAGDIQDAIRPHFFYTSLWERFRSIPERFNMQTKGMDIPSYPLRPEFIESTFMLYQATKNPYYLRVGEMVLNDLNRYARTSCGFAGFKNLKDLSMKETRMESFFLSETLKYLYLLFDENNFVNKMDSNSVFTTEGHIIIIPHEYTVKDTRVNRTCPVLKTRPFVYLHGPNINYELQQSCRAFVAPLEAMHDDTVTELQTTFSNPIDVIFPINPNQPAGRPVKLNRNIYLNNPLNIVFTLKYRGAGYIVSAINHKQLDPGGKVYLHQNGFSEAPMPLEIGNENLAAIIKVNGKYIRGSVSKYGYLLHHGLHFDGKIRLLKINEKDDSSLENLDTGCTPIDMEETNFGSILVVKRGSCDFLTKSFNALLAGYKALIVLSDVYPLVMSSQSNDIDIISVLLPSSSFETFKEAISIQISFMEMDFLLRRNVLENQITYANIPIQNIYVVEGEKFSPQDLNLNSYWRFNPLKCFGKTLLDKCCT